MSRFGSKRHLADAKDPGCFDESGFQSVYEFDSDPGDFRASWNIEPDMSVGPWAPQGQERYYFFEVLVRIKFPQGSVALNSDTGKYRTYELTVTDGEYYFDKRRPTGKGG